MVKSQLLRSLQWPPTIRSHTSLAGACALVHRMKSKLHQHDVEGPYCYFYTYSPFLNTCHLYSHTSFFQPCRATYTCTYYYLALSYFSAVCHLLSLLTSLHQLIFIIYNSQSSFKPYSAYYLVQCISYHWSFAKMTLAWAIKFFFNFVFLFFVFGRT